LLPAIIILLSDAAVAAIGYPVHTMRTSVILAMAWLLACGRAKVRDLPPGEDAGSDAGFDAGEDAGPDASVPPDVDAGTDAGTDAGPVTYTVQRVALHVHSAISHDACDGHGESGGPLLSLDQECIDQIEAAFCASKIDVAFLTDHPNFMDSKPLTDDMLLRGRGEQPLFDRDGNTVGMQLSCGTQLAAGWEATHSMPLGLARMPADHVGTAIDESTALADEEAMIAAVHDAGGIVFTAHSEEPDITAINLEQLETDGMEWYNFHGNFLVLLGLQGDVDVVGQAGSLVNTIDALKGLEPFLQGGSAAADLAILPMMEVAWPEAGLQKWHDVLSARRITGGLGNDVHRNVSVKPLCKGAVAMAACQAIASAYPNVLTTLASGGQIMLSDGERLDSYARVLRWLNNRALVTTPGIDGAREALRHGRSYGVFAVFGEPGPVGFTARTADGTVLQMGDTAPAAGTTLVLRLADPPAPELGPQWSSADAARAQIHTLLWRDTASGSQLAAEWTQNSTTVEFPAIGHGRYSVEVRITPHHLDGLGAGALTDHEYRWVFMNPIELR
jgi:hypothetical protein